MRFTSLRALAALSLVPLATFVACHSSSSGGGAPASPFPGDVPISSTITIDHLSGPVDVVRDQHGMIHIYASNSNDLLRVEGYQVARDRGVQLELIRRFAEGRTAELLGDTQPQLIDGDIAMRTVGLHRTAKAMYEALAPGDELRGWLDAYTDGISQFNARVQSGDEQIPKSVIGISHAAFEPWQPWEPLAIARLQSQQLAYTADQEIAETEFVAKARATFNAAATDPLLQKRAGFLIDFVRFAPLDPTLTLDGIPNDGSHTLGWKTPQPQSVATNQVPMSLLEATHGWRAAHRSVLDRLGKKGFTGSNNWMVGPSRTANGHAMLANDPHLALSAPSVFWMVHLHYDPPAGADPATRVNAAGLAFPGIPGIILGFNENIAWGATTADYDVTDVYTEALSADGSAVTFNGASVAITKIHETIKIAGAAPLEYDVLVVPHHGPIVPTIVNHKIVAPNPTVGAMSVKWIGYPATKEFAFVGGMLRAKDVEEVRTSVRNFEVGAQNWISADTKGNIFYTTQSTIPTRDKRAFTWDATKFEGTIPCMVLPGDGTAEWTGKLDEAFVPHAKNPAKAYIGTANGDQVGVTLDNDPTNDTLPNGQPVYLGCWHDPGYRVGRVHQRIEKVGMGKMTLDEMASIQADARSAMGAALAPKLLDALTHAEEERANAGTHADLTAVVTGARYQAAPIAELRDAFAKWGSDSDYDAAAGLSLEDGSLSSDPKEANASKATLVFNTWLVRMISLVLDDEATKLGDSTPPYDLPRVLVWLMTADPTKLATYDAATKDSAIFDDLTTPTVESRDERAITSLLDAIDYLTTKIGADRNAWRWAKLHTLRFEALVPLWQTLSIPPIGDAIFPNGFPRHGDGYNIDVGDFGHHPAKLADVDFTYNAGPTQRFVIDLDPTGPVARNVLPGGEVWDNASPHFRDEAEMWRKNQNHPVAFALADVVKTAEERIQYKSGAATP